MDLGLGLRKKWGWNRKPRRGALCALESNELDKCKDERNLVGLHISTWTESRIGVDCDLRSERNMKHIIKVKNKRLYHVDLEVNVSLEAPKKIEFSYEWEDPPNFVVENETWRAKRGISNNKEYEWSDVTLLSTAGSGQQTINIEIKNETVLKPERSFLAVDIDI